MPDKTSRIRVKSDGQSPPTVDGQTIHNEILLGLSARNVT